MKYPVIVIAALFTAACASIRVSPQATPQLKAGRSIEIGSTAVAQVGDPLLSEFNYYVQTGAVTKAPYEREIGFATLNVPSGMRLVNAQVSGEDAYCTPQPVYFVPAENRAICLFDTKKNHVFDKFYVAGTLSGVRHDAYIPYSVEEAMVGSDGFKYELIYQGVERDVLHLSYREYKDSMARPAFQQDLVYTLQHGKPTPISFRGVKAEIISADNNQVRYRILNGFTK